MEPMSERRFPRSKTDTSESSKVITSLADAAALLRGAAFILDLGITFATAISTL